MKVENKIEEVVETVEVVEEVVETVEVENETEVDKKSKWKSRLKKVGLVVGVGAIAGVAYAIGANKNKNDDVVLLGADDFEDEYGVDESNSYTDIEESNDVVETEN